MVPLNSTAIRKTQNNLPNGPPKLEKAIKELQSMVIFIVQKRISSNFDKEIPLTKNIMKFWLPITFINSVVNNFQKGWEFGDESFIIQPSLLKITKYFTSIKMPYCELDEIKPKHILNKLHKLTNNSLRVVITWSLIGVVFVVRIALVKPTVMQRLDGMSMIIQVKVQNLRNTLEATSTTVLYGLSFQVLNEIRRPGRT